MGGKKDRWEWREVRKQKIGVKDPRTKWKREELDGNRAEAWMQPEHACLNSQ